MARRKVSIDPWEDIRNMKNVDQMFDLVSAGFYMAGHFNNPVPVEQGRRIFEAIKKILKSHIKGK